jgi:GtrA-like protein
VLHNFLWHERWTWSERASVSGRTRRLWRFHAVNGLVSIVGNLAAMPLLVSVLGISPLPANLMSVLLCSTVNFVAGHKLIWVIDYPGAFRLRRHVASTFALRGTAEKRGLLGRTSDLEPRTRDLGLHAFDDNHLGV